MSTRIEEREIPLRLDFDNETIRLLADAARRRRPVLMTFFASCPTNSTASFLTIASSSSKGCVLPQLEQRTWSGLPSTQTRYASVSHRWHENIGFIARQLSTLPAR